MSRVAQAQDGDIQRAAAKIEDQSGLRAGQALLIIQRRGNRLQLKRHPGKTGLVGALAQRIFGALIEGGVGIELHRPP